MTPGHETWMRLAIDEGERARGGTGDNPWVGCVIVDPRGELVGRGHTLGPGEDHAEIDAARDAQAHGRSVVGATLYSTLEPCAFHGRTPACARSIAERGIARVVIGMRDPHPRVNGAGTRILREAGVEVVEGVCESEVRRQLGSWVIEQHPHELRRRALTLPAAGRAPRLAAMYGVDTRRIDALLALPLAATSTRHSIAIAAPPARVYQALLDQTLIPRWRVPTGMRCDVHEFEPRDGGAFRVSLTYESAEPSGKTTAQTDTYAGYFERLVPDERVVERLWFETADPRMQGEMRIETTLSADGGGTRLVAVHDGLPSGVAPADNEAGWRDSLGKLAALLESSGPAAP